MKFSQDSIDTFFEYSVHIPTRTLYIGDQSETENAEVDYKTAAYAIKALHLLDAISHEEIRILVNTLGGCVYSAAGIFDAIKACKSHVTAEAIGACMSSGAVILQAADHRVIHPSATFMLHDGVIAMADHARDVETWANWSKQQRRRMYEILASRTDRKWTYWARKCGNDVVLDAETALSEKLVDQIAGYNPPLTSVA